MNERQTVPLTQSGRIIFGAVGGTATFLLHRYVGGFEWGYAVILVLNVISPFLEMATRPKALSAKES